MAFDLHIDTDNAAFAERHQLSGEISSILAKVDYVIAQGANMGHCFDSNGNMVGSWKLKEED